MSLFDMDLEKQEPSLYEVIRVKFKYIMDEVDYKMHESIQTKRLSVVELTDLIKEKVCNAIGPLFVCNRRYRLLDSEISFNVQQYPRIYIHFKIAVIDLETCLTSPYEFCGYINHMYNFV